MIIGTINLVVRPVVVEMTEEWISELGGVINRICSGGKTESKLEKE